QRTADIAAGGAACSIGRSRLVDIYKLRRRSRESKAGGRDFERQRNSCRETTDETNHSRCGASARCRLAASGGAVSRSSGSPRREPNRWSRRDDEDRGRRSKARGRSETGDSGTEGPGKNRADQQADGERRA